MTNEDNFARVGKALLLLRQGLRPFVEREIPAAHPDGRNEGTAENRFRSTDRPDDLYVLLQTMELNWNSVFGRKLGRFHRSIVNELREHRNQWAYQQTINDEDAYRALDSAERLLGAIGAHEAESVRDLRLEL
jgi:Swt1-like HEPN